jgi:hypothetical protein
MSQPEGPRKDDSRVVSTSVLVCVVIGIVGFYLFAPGLLPPPPEGGKWDRVLWGAVVGVTSFAIGWAIGTGIEKMRRK